MSRRNLAATAAAVAATAALGSVASADTRSPWYLGLDKPSIQPPAVVFPVVWTTLYTDIVVTSARAQDRLEGALDEVAAYRRALAVNLALNASWSWVFFKAHRLGPAVAVAAALTVSSAGLVRRTYEAEPAAGLALAPYAGWCAFATVLSAALWRRNR